MKMKKLKQYACCFCLIVCSLAIHAQSNNELWYKQPAEKWTDALPLGNGKIGAMIFGGVEKEHVQFNEATLWTGAPREYARKNAYKYLPEIRKLLQQGKQTEAESLAEQHFMGLRSNEDDYDSLKKVWLKKIRLSTKQAKENYNDVDWKEMELPTLNGWERIDGMEGVDGAVWFRTNFYLPASFVGKNVIMYLGKIRDDDYTYVNGVKVGEMQGMNNRRQYVISAKVLHAGKNTIAVQVINWFDKGGLVGTKDRTKEFVLFAEGSTKDSLQLSKKWKYQIQDADVPEMPRYEADYQPFGDVWFHFNHKNISGYRRWLNLDSAVAGVSYVADGTTFHREYFISQPANAMAMHFSADAKNKISLTASFSALHTIQKIQSPNRQTLTFSVQIKNGALKGFATLYVTVTNGKIENNGKQITIIKANDASFYLTAATNFINYKSVRGNPQAKCSKVMDGIHSLTYQSVKQNHVKEYQQYFKTFSLHFNTTSNAVLPTDERIKQFSTEKDASFVALYVQYARYLMISSSRPDAPQPANLQGIWNDQLTPPWGSKFTTNINLEMNYWPVDVLNVSACSMPLFNLIKDVAEAGKQTAKEHYDASGWVLHHNTDIWRGTAPINASNHGIWVTGGAWLCHHIWEHYQFTGDKNFLAEYYSIIKSCVQFFNDFLVKDSATEYFISIPSNSPEHGGLVAGPTMDHQLIRDVFKNFIAASELLNVDDSLRKEVAAKYKLIAPNKIGKYGQLQEWMQDIDDPKDNHRHVSHLWGVFPGTDITWKDSLFMNAAKQSLLQRGDGGTGWSLAWKVNLWARLKDGNHAMIVLNNLFAPADVNGEAEKGGIYKNMFDAHPPFQIDGNFGGAAGVAEMLLQSQNNFVELLPALPTVLKTGEVKGICARGGLTFNIQWQNGELVSFEVQANTTGNYAVHYKSIEKTLSLEKNKWYSFNNVLERIQQ